MEKRSLSPLIYINAVAYGILSVLYTILVFINPHTHVLQFYVMMGIVYFFTLLCWWLIMDHHNG